MKQKETTWVRSFGKMQCRLLKNLASTAVADVGKFSTIDEGYSGENIITGFEKKIINRVKKLCWKLMYLIK